MCHFATFKKSGVKKLVKVASKYGKKIFATAFFKKL